MWLPGIGRMSDIVSQRLLDLLLSQLNREVGHGVYIGASSANFMGADG
jgi:hypothetical protein